jgi:dolichol-phosphate mannosyltransferase
MHVAELSGPAVSAAEIPLSAPGLPRLSVIVPTLNEQMNVRSVVSRLSSVLSGAEWEVIFVDDDSKDGTAAEVKSMARNDARVRCIRRIGRRGLAGACIEGVLASHADYVAVMDCDRQHDERLIPDMLNALSQGRGDIAVASRYLPGSQVEGLSKTRQRASRIATALSRFFVGPDITDPLSGFFMMRREVFDGMAPKLSTQGFKLLLDILMLTGGRARVLELPYTFHQRQAGLSKLDARTFVDFADLVVTRVTWGLLPPRFVNFLAVGASGIIVHMAVLKALLVLVAMPFAAAQAFATVVAMSNNFVFNNLFTFRDQRLRGLAALRGLLVFYLIGSIGALSNVGVASLLYANRPVWWVAGFLGSIVGAVWNYAMSNTFVWGR